MPRTPRLLAATTIATAMLASGLPAGASTEEIPGYCGRNPSFLTNLSEDATLVEKTLYFHGATPSGDLGVRANVDDTYMDENPPTSPVPKEKINLGGVANDAANKNSLATYWVGKLAAPERIVCAQVDFTAADSDPFSTTLWLDQPRGADGAPIASGSANTAGEDDINTYTGTFGSKLDGVAYDEIVVQMLATTAAPVLYDAVDYAGSLTYLVVEE